jgi:hypothetical protein
MTQPFWKKIRAGIGLSQVASSWRKDEARRRQRKYAQVETSTLFAAVMGDVNPYLLVVLSRKAARDDPSIETGAERGMKLVPSHVQRVTCGWKYCPWGETLNRGAR